MLNNNKKHNYQDPSRSIKDRLNDLLSLLTINEKIDQLSNSTPEIERLGIPAYNYWNESLHGIARNGKATVFPQAIGLAASWAPELIYRVANAISDEARAKYNESLKRNNKTLIYQGLTYWSPNINIFRDPRWGRGQETYGEDPYLTGELATAYVKGMQGDHPRYLKTAACSKHFAVHSGPEGIRHNQNVEISQQEIYRTYLPAFKKLVTKAKVEIVMGAYNALNGTPCCTNTFLLKDLLQDQWGFDGHVVSDCDAFNDLPNYYNHELDHVETTALAIKSGCDLVCGCAKESMREAIERGLLTEEDVDLALEKILRTRFRLGMFDDPENNPYNEIPKSVIDCESHRSLAYEAASKSIVLLKNDNNLLPLDVEKIENLLIVGPTATSMEILLGNYFGVSSKMVTVLEGLISKLPEGVRVQYRKGISLNHHNTLTLDWAINEAKVSDVTIVCLGLTPQFESEEGDAFLSNNFGDKETIDLPPNQLDYLRKLSKTGTKVVLCLSGGSAINIAQLREYADAILFIWYPGEEGGNAVADILIGNEVPSGKLPVTFIESVDKLPEFEDYTMEGRTYRFSTDNIDYPFGFGLSYSSFEYSNLKLSTTKINSCMALSGSFMLTNTGGFDAEEVVQIYLEYPKSAYGIKYQLVDFKRVVIRTAETMLVEFHIDPEKLLVCNPEGDYVLHPGEYKLIVGGCAPGDAGIEKGAAKPIVENFVIYEK